MGFSAEDVVIPNFRGDCGRVVNANEAIGPSGESAPPAKGCRDRDLGYGYLLQRNA